MIYFKLYKVLGGFSNLEWLEKLKLVNTII
jgi:hypothetical protein